MRSSYRNQVNLMQFHEYLWNCILNKLYCGHYQISETIPDGYSHRTLPLLSHKIAEDDEAA